jgi:hypothetical protein
MKFQTLPDKNNWNMLSKSDDLLQERRMDAGKMEASEGVDKGVSSYHCGVPGKRYSQWLSHKARYLMNVYESVYVT